MSSLSSHEEASGGDEFVGQIPLKKGQWTSEEDAILTEYVKKHGEGNWNAVQKNSELARSGKSCRLRWINHLRPYLKKGPFTLEEERKIIELHAQIGNKWSLMVAELPGRTDNEIKNYWNTRKKKMERAGLPLYPDDISPRVLLDGNQENSNVSTSQHADVLQENNPDIPDVKFRNYKLSQEYSSYTPTISDTIESSMFEEGSDSSLYPMIRPLRQVRDSDVLYNSLDSTCISSSVVPALIGHNLCGRYTGLSGSTSIYGAMKPELPSLPCIETQQGSRWDTPACPLPSFDESVDTLIQYLPAEQTHESESVSPRSSGLLESIFYPPKILEGSNNDSLHPCNTEWDEQGEPNSTKKEDLNRRDLTNQDALPDLDWSGNDNVYNKDQSDSDPIKDTLFAILGKDFHGYH